VLAYEYTNRGNDDEQTGKAIRRNQQTVSLGGSYDFGVAKVFGLAQYSDGSDGFAHFATVDELSKLYKAKGKLRYDGFKGWAAHLGAAVPVCGGTVTTGVYYKDAESQKTTIANNAVEDLDGTFIGVNVQYAYPLSKRTHVYCGAGYGRSKLESKETTLKTEESIGYVGMAHFF
jgi:predicted porin